MQMLAAGQPLLDQPYGQVEQYVLSKSLTRRLIDLCNTINNTGLVTLSMNLTLVKNGTLIQAT